LETQNKKPSKLKELRSVSDTNLDELEEEFLEGSGSEKGGQGKRVQAKLKTSSHKEGKKRKGNSPEKPSADTKKKIKSVPAGPAAYNAFTSQFTQVNSALFSNLRDKIGCDGKESNMY
jgi:hypothetical protein